jgi:hypothetical protein
VDRALDQALTNLIEEIERFEDTRKRFGKVLRELKGSINLGSFPAIATGITERSFLTRIEPTSLNGLKIAGIDGGLSRKRFRSMDLLMTRAVGVIFHFGPEEGPEVEFYPDAFPEPDIKPVLLRLATNELDQMASLERMIVELRTTLSILEEFHTDLILVDGSLFYHPRDRPPSGSVVSEKFEEVLALYRQLYHKASKSRTTLVGVVKDSRSMRVVDLLGDILPHVLRNPSAFDIMQGVDYRWLLKISRDCDILDTFLEEGERTFTFRYSTELPRNSNSLTEDVFSWASSIWVTYLKTARDDLPLRVEVFMKQNESKVVEKLNKALSVILPLSWQHPEYGLPTPIVEADTRARIANNEAQLIIDRLMALSGLTYTSLEKRRSRNPFGG